jgi:hypothetical protein
VGSGGVVVTGAADVLQSASYQVVGAGGVLVSGAAAVIKISIYPVFASGGVLVSGAAAVSHYTVYKHYPVGGVYITGGALASQGTTVTYTYAASGGVIVRGEAITHKLPFEVFPSGGVLISGEINSILPVLIPLITVFDAVITGSNDELNDYSLLLKSFSGTLYSGLTSTQNYQFINHPGAIRAILNRPGGEIVLYRNKIEVLRGEVASYTQHTGPSSRTLSVSTSYIKTEVTQKIVQALVETIEFDFTGKRTFVIPGFLDINPLDYFRYKGQDIEIDFVVMILGTDAIKFKLKEK